jgi:hypothetical protein
MLHCLAEIKVRLLSYPKNEVGLCSKKAVAVNLGGIICLDISCNLFLDYIFHHGTMYVL